MPLLTSRALVQAWLNPNSAPSCVLALIGAAPVQRGVAPESVTTGAIYRGVVPFILLADAAAGTVVLATDGNVATRLSQVDGVIKPDSFHTD